MLDLRIKNGELLEEKMKLEKDNRILEEKLKLEYDRLQNVLGIDYKKTIREDYKRCMAQKEELS